MVVIEEENPPQRSKTISIADMITNIFEAITPLQRLRAEVEEEKKKIIGDDWDYHCRLPSHSTQIKVMGTVARDISSYFIRVCIIIILFLFYN